MAMKRAKSTAAATQIEARPERAPALSVVPRPVSLATARIESISETGVVVHVGGARVVGSVDPSVHPAVLEGALRRGERVLVEQGADGGVVIIGALRTQPTPGVDQADAYVIEAKRITLEASDEVSVTTRTAAVVLRAIGEVETYADRIISRAEGVHKIVGRILRLN
jgi:hypothetical protein